MEIIKVIALISWLVGIAVTFHPSGDVLQGFFWALPAGLFVGGALAEFFAK